MMLVEYARLRWWFALWGGFIVLAGIALATTVSHQGVVVNDSRVNAIVVPAAVLAPVAMFLTMVFATSAGLSLNREWETRALSWTKPVPRALIALRLMAVDVIALFAMYVVSWVAIVGVVAGAQGRVLGFPGTAAVVTLSFGVVLMWYALIEALTAALPSGGRAVVGFLWPAALFLSAIGGHLGGTLGTIVRVLNALNPLAYYHVGAATDLDAVASGVWRGAADERALIVWFLSLLLCAAAIALWTRREA